MKSLALATVDTFRNQIICCDAFTLLRSLPDASVDMILTDMPYGTTACSWDTVIDLDAWWVEAHRVAKPRAAIVCTGSQPFTSRLVMSNAARFRYEWIWIKNVGSNFLNTAREPMKEHETIAVFCNDIPHYFPQRIVRRNQDRVKYPYRADNKKRDGYGNFDFGERVETDIETRVPSSVLYYVRETGFHFNQKPVALFEYLIRTYTQPGDLVLDPFVGSGTTALAARACGRDYICGDSDAGYVAIARDRLRLPFEPRQVKQETRLDDLPLFAALPEAS